MSFPGSPSHRSECVCTVCQRIRANHAAGRPTTKEVKANRKIRSPKKTIFAESVASQIRSGQKPNLTKAALAAGYKPESAPVIAAELVRQDRIQKLVLASLERAGITQDTLSATASDGLKATETKVVTYEGKVTEKVELPDHHARFKYWESLNRIFGNFPKEENVQQAALIVKMPTDASADQAETALATYFEQRSETR